MKTLSVLLLALALGVTFASVGFANCPGHSKTATTAPPTMPAPSTTKA